MAIDLWLQSRHGSNTQRAYEQAARLFQSELGTPIDQAQRADVVRWQNAMKARGLEPSTINQRVAALSSYFHFCERVEERTGNPADVERLRTENVSKAVSLSADEARRLLEVIRRRRDQGKTAKQRLQGAQDYALFLGYILLGLRSQAWRQAQWSDFEMDAGGKIYYRWQSKGKSGLDEVPEVLYRALMDYRKQYSHIGKHSDVDIKVVFKSLGGSWRNLPASRLPKAAEYLSGAEVIRRLRRYARMAGIEKDLVVHSLRHASADLLREVHADNRDLMEHLHHSNGAVTERYLQRKNVRLNRYANDMAERIGAR